MVVKKVQREVKGEEAQQAQIPEAGFEFNELNRAVEVARWFENTVIPLLTKRGVPEETIAGLSVAFATKLSEAVIRKYITTVATINLEKAIEIIDEELPKLIKQSQSSLDVDSVLKTWSLMKEILAKGGGKLG